MVKKLLLSALCAVTLLANCNVAALANTTDITEGSDDKSAEIEVTVEINSQFTVGIPIKATIDKDTGTGTYKTSVSGDLDPRYKLVVTPVDTYTTELGDTTSDVNFLLSDKSSALNKKDDIVVNITAGQTEFICTDINLDTPVEIDNSMAIADGYTLTAGEWGGVIKYAISLEEIPTN